MKRILSCITALLLLLAMLSGCIGANDDPFFEIPQTPPPTQELPPEPAIPTPSPLEIRAQELLSGMTAEEKVWQLFMLWPHQLAPEAQIYTEASHAAEIFPAGGIILNASNMVTEEQTAGLIKDLQALSEIPMLVAVDEEGGIVARVGPTLGKTTLSSMYNYREEGPDTARENAKTLAADIASLGFNVDFAPVADVWTNPENTVIGHRAYSNDPEEAAQLVAAAVEGFHQGGVAATLKHFPGHGNTAEDSHNGAAYSGKTLSELRECELLPFIAGIEAGADLVMIGHITMTAIDPDHPATFSKAIVTELLRDSLGFDGVIVTDSLGMGAVTNSYGAEASLLALQAGCDLLLAPDDAQAAVDLILEKADPARIDESVLRILRLKLECGIIE